MVDVSVPTSSKTIYDEILSHQDANQIKFPNNTNTYAFDYNDFEQQEPIGCGIYTVYKYLHQPTQTLMAVKRMPMPVVCRYRDKKKEAQAQKILNEIEIHQKLGSSPHIVTFFGFFILNYEVYLCMELMEETLVEYYHKVHKQYSYFPENLIGYIAVPVVNALNDAKNKHIMHRDVKPTNILINKNKEVKLCDFGNSKMLEKSLVTTTTGTPYYMAPEAVDNNTNGEYGYRADVWSLGITLAETIKNELPFTIKTDGLYYLQFFQYISSISSEEIINNCFETKQKYYELSEDFLKLCLQDTNLRPDCTGLKETKLYQTYSKMAKEELLSCELKTLNTFKLKRTHTRSIKQNHKNKVKKRKTILQPQIIVKPLDSTIKNNAMTINKNGQNGLNSYDKKFSTWLVEQDNTGIYNLNDDYITDDAFVVVSQNLSNDIKDSCESHVNNDESTSKNLTNNEVPSSITNLSS